MACVNFNHLYFFPIFELRVFITLPSKVVRVCGSNFMVYPNNFVLANVFSRIQFVWRDKRMDVFNTFLNALMIEKNVGCGKGI